MGSPSSYGRNTSKVNIFLYRSYMEYDESPITYLSRSAASIMKPRSTYFGDVFANIYTLVTQAASGGPRMRNDRDVMSGDIWTSKDSLVASVLFTSPGKTHNLRSKHIDDRYADVFTW